MTFSPALDAYLVTRYDDIRAILLQPELFSSKDALRSPGTLSSRALAEFSQGYPQVPTTTNSDGREHQRTRVPLQRAFSAARMKALEPAIRETVTRLIDAFIDDGHAELISQFATLLPLHVICSLLGIPEEERADVMRWSDDWSLLISYPLSEERQVACVRSIVAFQRYCARLIAERRRAPREDLITDLIEFALPGEVPLNEARLVTAVSGILIAGHETASGLLSNALKLFLEVPERWQTLVKEPELIPRALEEVLRYDGAVQSFFRTAMQETTVGGVSIPAGALLVLLYGSANRDEEQFPHADAFDLRREPNRHLAFGHGVHFCIGAPLARMQGRIAFEELTQRLPHLQLLPGQSLTHVPLRLARRYEQLLATW